MKNPNLYIPEEYSEEVKKSLEEYYNKKMRYLYKLSGDVKLELGNEQQLKILDDISRREASLLEEEEEYGTLKKRMYKVTIEFSGTWEDEIEAYDEEEAKEIARDDINIDDADYDIERTNCELL
jgi:hypothetical protein